MEWLSANTCVCSNHAICFDDMLGYNEMLCRIKPSKIICYGKPFEEMKGDIIKVDYAKTNNLQNQTAVCISKPFMAMLSEHCLKKAAALQADKTPAILSWQTLCRLSQSLIPNWSVIIMVKKFKKDIMMKTEKQKWILITQITVTLNDILMCLISICG